MSKPDENNSSSSGDFERVTIAYTESVHAASDEKQWSSEMGSSDSSISSNLEVPNPKTMYTGTFRALDVLKEMQTAYGYEPVWRTMSTSDGPKTRAQDYLRSHSIFQLFSFLMSHLLAKSPEEPITYILSVVDRCLEYRDRGGDPPTLFEESHIRSIYSEFDPLKSGFIHYSHYICGMNILGLTDFNIMPEGMTPYDHYVSKEGFVYEAKQAMLVQLDRMLGKAQPTGPSRDTMALIVADEEAEDDHELADNTSQHEGLPKEIDKENGVKGKISHRSSTSTQITFKTTSEPRASTGKSLKTATASS